MPICRLPGSRSERSVALHHFIVGQMQCSVCSYLNPAESGACLDNRPREVRSGLAAAARRQLAYPF